MYFHIYNPISSWQSSKTNQAHCPVQDVTTKGLPSVSSLVCGNTIIRESNSIWGTHENKQKEFLIDY